LKAELQNLAGEAGACTFGPDDIGAGVRTFMENARVKSLKEKNIIWTFAKAFSTFPNAISPMKFLG
jgi:hypothetical protein